MAIRTIKTDKLRWINIDDFDKPAASFLRKNFHFHPLDIKDCFQDNRHPKMDSYSKYIFLVLNFPELDNRSSRIIRNELDIFLGRDFVITVQKKRFKALKNTFYRVAKNSKVRENFFSADSANVLYKILEELYKSTFSMIRPISLELNEIEKQLFEEETGQNFLVDLGKLRRNILNFRTIIDPQRYTINSLVHAKNKFIPEEGEIYFDDIHDKIEEIWVILNNYLAIARNLHEMNESLIQNKTNKVIKVLTVISVALLPLTLLSGIYGMNVEGLPGAGHPAFVFAAFGLILAVIIGALAYLRKKNWI